MAGDVTHGADPDRLERIADVLRDLAASTRGVGATGSTYITTLGDCWMGADLEYFQTSWDAVRGQIDPAADHLASVSRALKEQAEQQRHASGGGAGPGGGAPGPVAPGGGDPAPGPTPSPKPPTEPAEPDPTPSPSPGPPPVPPEERTIDSMEDPGEDTEVPDGLDPDDPWVEDMMATPEGRKTLQYLHDHGYTIDTSGSEGDKYYHSGTTIYLGPSWQDGGALIHEANHAEASVTGTTTTFDDSREDYVDGKIDEEVESSARQLEWGRQHGPDQPMQSTYDRAYETARDDALDAGRSPSEAAAAGEAAGRREIREALESGRVSPTGSSGDYRDYYGSQWDDANEDDGPWWWPF